MNCLLCGKVISQPCTTLGCPVYWQVEYCPNCDETVSQPCTQAMCNMHKVFKKKMRRCYECGKMDSIGCSCAGKKFWDDRSIAEQASSLLKSSDKFLDELDRKIKMTRDEAVKQLYNYYGGSEASHLIGALEALGLLKFDEVKQEAKLAASTIIMRELGRPIDEVLTAIEKLKKAGYKIVDTDVCEIVDKRKSSALLEARLNCKLRICNNPDACSLHNNCGGVLPDDKPTIEVDAKQLAYIQEKLKTPKDALSYGRYAYTVLGDFVLKEFDGKQPVAWRVGTAFFAKEQDAKHYARGGKVITLYE